MTTNQAAKLQIEVVPQTCWYKNLRLMLPKSEWDHLRKMAYNKYKYRCAICGGKGNKHPVEAHEKWEYDESTGIQKLVDIIALCPACHEVVHFGLACMRGNEGRALEHLQKVNGWNYFDAIQHVDDAKAAYKRRSCMEWKTDVSLIKEWLEINSK